MTLDSLLASLKQTPDSIQFADVMNVIDSVYDFTPGKFKNGSLINEPGQNDGSHKLFAFAQLQQLDPESTLACFGDYYRVDVLQHAEGNDHQNIRNFIQFGWEGIELPKDSLTLK